MSEPRWTSLSLSQSIFRPLLAPPCEQTTWFVAGLMGWNVTGYVFICLIRSPTGVGRSGREKEGGRDSEVGLLSGFIIRHVCACHESVIDDALPPPNPTNTYTHTHTLTQRKTHALYGAITAGPLTPYICCVCAFRAPLVQDSVNNC